MMVKNDAKAQVASNLVALFPVADWGLDRHGQARVTWSPIARIESKRQREGIGE